MKIYFQNKAAKLKHNLFIIDCKRCPFLVGVPCPFSTGTTIDCYSKGWWIDGESPDIFKV